MKIKKILSFIFAFVIAISTTLTCFATSSKSQFHIASSSGSHITCDDLNKGASIFNEYYAQRAEASEYEQSIINAAKVVRDNMVKRNEYFEVEFQTTRNDLNDIMQLLLDLAISEELSNNSHSGDYLAWNYHSYYCDGYYTTNKGVNTVTFEYYFKYYTTKEQEDKVQKVVLSELAKMNLSSKSDVEKIQSIFNFVCQTCDYDKNEAYDGYLRYTAYAALINHTAVCQGYATLLYKMLKEAGIDNRLVGGGNHLWNIVKINGKYYAVDATWDDSRVDNKTELKYFLKCPKHFIDHTIEDTYLTTDFLVNYQYSPKCYGGCDAESNPDEIVHTYSYLSSVEPTCTKQGCSTYICDCGVTADANYTDALGHNMETKITTTANGSRNGVIRDACTRCDKASESSIPKLNGATLSTTTYTYNGSVKQPTITIKDINGKVLKKGTDYDVTYDSGRKNVGKYKVVAKMKGKYSGTYTRYFTIKPKTTSISSITPVKNGFKLTWKKQATQTTGYQIQYSTSSSFSSAKTVTVSKNSTVSKTISKLVAKKKYYVRIRTYKTVDGTKYYSTWSASKSVTTKK